MRTRTLIASLGCLATIGLIAKAASSILPFQFDSPPTPACGTTFTIQAGQTLSFTIQISDGDPSEVLVMRTDGNLPPGATTNPPLPISGQNSLSSVFSWTPTPAQVGPWFFGFSGINSGGVRIDCFYNVVVEPAPPGDDFCTYTQGGWGSKPSGGNPGALLKSVFGSAFPAGVEIGIAGAGGFSLRFTSAAAIEKYLPAGGTAKALAADATNPTTSKGVFSAQVLALKLNVELSAGGFIPGADSLGGAHLCNTGNALLDGQTVAEVLAAAENALGGGGLAYGFTSISSFNDLVTALNEGFDDCHANDWASAHICP